MRAGFQFPAWAPGTTLPLAFVAAVQSNIILPNDSAGRKPKFVLLTLEPGFTATRIYLLFGGAADVINTALCTAFEPDVLTDGYLIVRTGGFNRIFARGVTGGGTLRVTPLENY